MVLYFCDGKKTNCEGKAKVKPVVGKKEIFYIICSEVIIDLTSEPSVKGDQN